MEKLIFLVAVVVISMLHSWWQKRKGEGEPESPAWPVPNPRRPSVPPRQSPQTRPPQPPAASWEDELRRLLQGEEPSRPAAPPVVVQSAPPPPLPRAAAPRPRVLSKPEPVLESDSSMETGLPVQMPTLEHSAQAFLRASQLESKVAAHMNRVDQQVTTHAGLEVKRQTSPAVQEALGLVRNRQSQRAAILAGIILGPPKAMEG